MIKKITVFLENEEISFSIDKYKIIYGNNYNKAYKLVRKIEQYINKQDNTEYIENNFKNAKVLLDGEPLHQNNSVFITISQYFDLDNDLKLGAKSLLLKYLESKLYDLEYDDNFTMIKNFIYDLNLNYFEEKVNIEQSNIKLKFSIEELSFKKIIKLLETEMTKDDLIVNMYDLSYYEIIKLQLYLISEISKKSDKQYYVLLDLYIDDRILKLIEQKMINDNIYVFIITNCKHKPRNINNYLFVNKKTIDFSNEIDIYENVMNSLPFHVDSIENFVAIFNNYIEFNYNNQTIEFEKII